MRGNEYATKEELKAEEQADKDLRDIEKAYDAWCEGLAYPWQVELLRDAGRIW